MLKPSFLKLPLYALAGVSLAVLALGATLAVPVRAPPMDADGYARALPPLGVDVAVLPGLDHMAVVSDPAALAAIVAAVTREPRASVSEVN